MNINRFDFQPGKVLSGKYRVVSQLGGGWEGEVYLVQELETRIERTAKFYYPHRNRNNRTLMENAKRLHTLRYCSIIIRYHSQDWIRYRGQVVRFLVSEYVEGEVLTQYVSRQRGKRLDPFRALHLLNALATGMQEVHQIGEYHGDLHAENILVERVGLNYHLRLLDIFKRSSKRDSIRDDVCDMIRIFYDALGGQSFYSKHEPAVKGICLGLRRDLILKKFKSAEQLKAYLDTVCWS